jgi:hypothetical protein
MRIHASNFRRGQTYIVHLRKRGVDFGLIGQSHSKSESIDCGF